MPVYKELIRELSASGFTSSGQIAKGRIYRAIPDGPYSCETNETVRGVKRPAAQFETEEEARAALIEFWEECEQALKKSGMPNWQTTYG
ncbi:hypothetical protein [Stutzerimonas nitrititolerans]|uniref:Uncharacterized protein n=1 Tax=Stutzerimonas nitrititolerans TaxID=2482751 RepID=A0ABX9V3Y3_9GAMM|nr:hypothetical protein [Stutzerimonas nitrititolerans]RMI00487.1 hypothetical protein EA795_13285 [Stutzerimonas nitrititolerans]